MKIITKNNKQFYRFKIGDEFTAISGKGSFNKMKKEGLCSDTYNEEQGFIYPFYDGSTINNHIKGYCKEYNYDGIAIKVAKDGAESGNTKYIKVNLLMLVIHTIWFLNIFLMNMFHYIFQITCQNFNKEQVFRQ